MSLYIDKYNIYAFIFFNEPVTYNCVSTHLKKSGYRKVLIVSRDSIK